MLPPTDYGPEGGLDAKAIRTQPNTGGTTRSPRLVKMNI
jgi:hypothetical protein